MFCKYCGKQIDDDSAFCQHCGKKQRDQREGVQQSDFDPILSEIKSEELIENTFPEVPQKLSTITLEATDESIEVPIEKAGAEDEKCQPAIPEKRRLKLMVIFTPIIAVLALAALFLSGALGGSHRELSASKIAKFSDSVLTLFVYDKNHDLLSTGSGFVVNDDKTIMTNYHVIDQGYFVEAVSEKDIHYNISGVTFFDEAADIAVLKFETGTGLSPLVIADSSSVQVGDTIYAIGSPLGLKNTVSNGIISAIRAEGSRTDIQITAPISSGSSGGVLLNAYGEVIGITYASYLDGQNLNLAIPSVEFSDKLQSDEIQRFEKIALYAAPLGNSIENYSTHGTRLVQHGNSIYEAYNSKDEISVYDISTKESKKLGISGTNLSIYRGVLYYVSSDSTIGTYDITTGEICKNILLNYPPAARVNTISGLYISNHGISVIYDVGLLNTALIQLDFDGTIIGGIDNLSGRVVLADADTLVGYDYKNWELEFISLSDLDSFSVPVDFEPGFMCADKDGYLYIADTTENKFGRLVKFDLHTGDYIRINRLDAGSYGCFVYNGKIFYPATNGTTQMSTLGAGWKTISKNYALSQICFSDDGKLYAIGKSPDASLKEYTEYYIRVNSDGSQLEVLDSKEIKW